MRDLGIVIIFLLIYVSLAISAGGQEQPVLRQDRKSDRAICITFDDLPVAHSGNRIERLMITDMILGTLDEFGVKAAGFVIGNNIGDDIDILERWLAEGHTLGNHTYSHSDLNDVPPTLYLHNIEKCQDILDSLMDKFGRSKKYFRYPSLHYGNTGRAKESVAEYLKKNDYVVAQVSVGTDDFVYNLQFEKFYKMGDSLEFIRLGNEYIDHLLEKLDSAEQLSEDIVGRPIRHIILLHANLLNSNFLADILAELQFRGYRFVDLDEALADQVYSTPESYIGNKGLAYLERLARTDPDLLPARE